jgi:D-sedoheptulose 7-phosphate isomerase
MPGALVARRFQRSCKAPTAFFGTESDRLSRACLAMARRFQRGGRLLVFGEGAQATDAHHVAVEFVHPVLVGKRALPAIALTTDARIVETIARPDDIAMAISCDAGSDELHRALDVAQSRGLLTLHLAGGEMPPENVDYAFVVPTDDAMVVQEVHETLYHVLWELVHVFFDHRIA